MLRFNRVGPKNSHQKKIITYDKYIKRKTKLCVNKYVPKRVCNQ